MILDAVTHVTPDGTWFSTSHDASERRLLAELDRAGVDRAVVVPLAGYIDNGFVRELCRRHRDRLIPGVSINPAAWQTISEVTAGVRALVRSEPMCLLKLHPRLNAYDPLEPRCLALLEELAASAPTVPVWLCSSLRRHGLILQKPPVDTLHTLVNRFPTLRFVLLHGGGPEVLALAEAMRDCPNAWLDLSWTVARYAGSSVEADLRYVLRRFARKLVFGSDFPEVTPAEALDAFRRLAEDLDAAGQAAVLAGNVSRLLPSTANMAT